MEYCVTFGPIYCLNMLEELQKQVCSTTGRTLAASFEPLGFLRIIVNLVKLSTIIPTFSDLNNFNCNFRHLKEKRVVLNPFFGEYNLY